MTEIKEVRCPGCGKEMRRHRYDCGSGARIAWYECEICGWRAPMCADDNRAYEVAMRRCGDVAITIRPLLTRSRCGGAKMGGENDG